MSTRLMQTEPSWRQFAPNIGEDGHAAFNLGGFGMVLEALLDHFSIFEQTVKTSNPPLVLVIFWVLGAFRGTLWDLFWEF